MPYGNSDSVLNAFTVSKSDTTTFPPFDNGTSVQTTKALYVGGTGDVAVVMQGGQSVIFVNVQGGTILPISVIKVLSTNTSATIHAGLWYELAEPAQDRSMAGVILRGSGTSYQFIPVAGRRGEFSASR